MFHWKNKTNKKHNICSNVLQWTKAKCSYTASMEIYAEWKYEQFHISISILQLFLSQAKLQSFVLLQESPPTKPLFGTFLKTNV